MRVGYDEQIMLAQNRGGISRYFTQLLQTFRDQPSLGVQPVLGWRWAPNSHAGEAGLSSPIAALQHDRLPQFARSGGYFLANTAHRRRARQCEVLHHTYSHERFLPKGRRGVRVSTIYDMIPELHPQLFADGNPHLGKRRYVSDSDVLICISESTRNDLIEIYGDPGKPTPVVYLGVDPLFAPGRPAVAGAPERFVLFVGSRGGYKDFAVLAEAFATLSDQSVALLAVGGGAFIDDELRTQRRLGIAGRVLRLDATDQQLAGLYAGALAFVFPSRHEGFGLPTLEAMASGIPVALADSSSHPEVGGDVARYFAPGDSAALAGILEELLGDEPLRRKLGERGVARAEMFSWESTARATALVYQQAAHG